MTELGNLYLVNFLFFSLLLTVEEIEEDIQKEIKQETSSEPFDLSEEDGIADQEIKVEVSDEIASSDYIPVDVQATDGENTNSSEATSTSEGGDTSKAGGRNVARRGKRKGGAARGGLTGTVVY